MDYGTTNARTTDPVKTPPAPLQLVAAALGCDVDTLSLQSGLYSHPAWDSMGHAAVIAALEKHYGIEITEESIRRFEQMHGIVECFSHLQSAMLREFQGFDSRWETDVYSRSRMLNRYPSEVVVSFVYSAFPKDHRAGNRVLDIGCGAGNNTSFLAGEGFDVVGIDGSFTAIQTARKRITEQGLRAEFIHSDFTKLQLADASIDCVIDRCSVTHNRRETINRVLDEVRRVLKPGGLFFSQVFSTRAGDIEFGVPCGDGSYSSFTKGYFSDIALTFFADRDDLQNLYETRFYKRSIQHVQTEDETGRVRMALWNTIWQRP